MTDEAGPGTHGSAEPAHCRPFGLLDAMILLAGAALSLAGGAHLILLLADVIGRFGASAVAHGYDLFADWPVFWRATHDHLRNVLWYVLQLIQLILLGITPAFLIVRFRRPRPAMSVVLRYAGTTAALAMVSGLFWVTGYLYILFPYSVRAETAAAVAVGGTVASVWGLSALTGNWRAEPGWIDRAGRFLGVMAIGIGLIGLVLFKI
jgi:hypothetical protein